MFSIGPAVRFGKYTLQFYFGRQFLIVRCGACREKGMQDALRKKRTILDLKLPFFIYLL